MIIHPQNIAGSGTYSRIISLVPSQTELLYDLELSEEVKAITKFCVHPQAWHKNKIRIGGTKNIKIDIIKKMEPDLIIANKEENVKDQVEELAETFDVFVTDINNLGDALEMIKNIGILTGKENKALHLADEIKRKFKKLQQVVSSEIKIKTVYLIWKDPYMAVGGNTFINDMMGCCGLENIFGDVDRYPELNLNDLQNGKIKSELVILSSEPYPFKEKQLKEIQSKIPGVKVILADGEMFSWYGSRLLKAADYFAMLRESVFL